MTDADTAAGTPVPPIGLGTWNTSGEKCAQSVERALTVGYRHIDTAQLYDNEAAVREGLSRSSVPRKEVFLADKVAPSMLGHEDLLESVQESRDRLGVEQIDCLYVHWPRDAYDPAETLSALDTLFRRGSIEGVGLSNFTPDLLDEALTRLNAPVLAHQVEMHPLLPQSELLEYAREHDHVLVAYSPLARGEVLDAPQVEAVANAHNATSAQVVLAWCRTKGAVPIPKATGNHILENYQGIEITLSESDVERIDSIDKTKRLVNPPSAPWD